MPPLGGHKKIGVKVTSKMNSAPLNYSDCKFSAKSANFIGGGGFFNILLGKNAPQVKTDFF